MQVSIFEMLDEYETPLIQPERQKRGMKGWIVEACGVFLRKNGYPGNWVGVCARQIVFIDDTRLKANGAWRQHCETKNRRMGWIGYEREVFSRKPSAKDCIKGIKKHWDRDWPHEIRYYEYDRMEEQVEADF